jgi:hypothetical protein
MSLQEWIDEKIADIANKLPTLVHTEPASFSCGYNTGYKQAMLDLDNIIEDGAEIYRSQCKCGDKYHGEGAICL